MANLTPKGITFDGNLTEQEVSAIRAVRPLDAALSPLASEKLAHRDAALLSLASARLRHRKLLGTLHSILSDLHDSATSIRHWAGGAGAAAAEVEGFLANGDTELNDALRDYRETATRRAQYAQKNHKQTEPK